MTTLPRRRCFWAEGDPLLRAYHDTEWGVPIRDDRAWFEKLILDGAQAGLSWLTILKKREGYRRAFRGFDPRVVARFSARDRARLLRDAGIVRNRAKIRSAVGNARAFLEIQRAFGSFDAYIWDFVGGQAVKTGVRRRADLPAHTPLSDRIAKDLKARGFSFVGSTIVYAFLQAAGVVNDHFTHCFRYRAIARNREGRKNRMRRAAT